MTRLGSLVVWAGPVLVAGLAHRVFRGEADAPLLGLLVLVAPLAALLRPGERLPAGAVSAGLALPGLALILCANLLLVERLLGRSGVPAPVALILALLILLAPLTVAASGRAASWLAAAGIVGIVVAAVAVAQATGAAPWTAWARAASRPAIVFSEGSPAVTRGRPVDATQALAFSEPHRVTAATSAAVRVVEADGDHGRVHERQLASGDSVLVRPGDRLLLESDARLRFEKGKRIPGAVPGPAWADPPGRRRPENVLGTIGLMVTVLGAALALVAPARAGSPGPRRDGPPEAAAAGPAGIRDAVVATAPLPVLTLATVSLGVYAMDSAPEILVGATLLTPLLEAPATLVPSPAGVARMLVALAVLVLFAGMTFVLASRVGEVVAAAAPRRTTAGALVWTALVTAAGAGSLGGGDAWTIWLLGLGLLAAGWAAPALGAGDERGAVAGGIVGVIVFAGLAWAPPAASWAAAGAAPALAAAPLAWAAARLASGEARPRRRVAAPARR